MILLLALMQGRKRVTDVNSTITSRRQKANAPDVPYVATRSPWLRRGRKQATISKICNARRDAEMMDARTASAGEARKQWVCIHKHVL